MLRDVNVITQTKDHAGRDPKVSNCFGGTVIWDISYKIPWYFGKHDMSWKEGPPTFMTYLHDIVTQFPSWLRVAGRGHKPVCVRGSRRDPNGGFEHGNGLRRRRKGKAGKLESHMGDTAANEQNRHCN